MEKAAHFPCFKHPKAKTERFLLFPSPTLNSKFSRFKRKKALKTNGFQRMAPPARLERTTFRLGGGPSILVRYGGKQKGL
jgi:hypothetical protein